MQALTQLSARPVRRPAKRRQGPLGRYLWRAVRVGGVLALCIALGSAWRSGRLDMWAAQASDDGVTLLARCGFRVEEVDVTGRVHTDRKVLLDAAGLNRGTPILGFSPEAIRKKIESLPWVETAAVERRLPRTVAITIVERTPIALWQDNKHISLIDAEGANLGPVALESARDLPMVVGGDAPSHTAALLDLLSAYPDIAKRVQASSWIGSRRWDLKMDNGVQVMLPETDVGGALRELADAEASSRLLERDVATVDLRIAGKMIVRLAHQQPAAAKPAKPQQGI
jgi:cell division protein FtsQ